MKQTLFAFGLLKDTDNIIMMFYKNMKTMDRSFDGDTDFFDIVTGDTLALCL